jgi:hypothetical protein
LIPGLRVTGIWDIRKDLYFDVGGGKGELERFDLVGANQL